MTFSEPYKVYLDITAQSDWVWNNDDDATWVEIDAYLPDFSDEQVDGEYFRRIKWGEIILRNKPFEATTLFNTIKGLSNAQEIRIKAISGTMVIRGYFGANDCDIDDDKKILKVTPAILDQYTLILENSNKKIDASLGVRNYLALYNINPAILTYTEDHYAPIKLKGVTDFEEAKTPVFSISPLPICFIQNTKYEYNLRIKASVLATTTGAWRLYVRRYNKYSQLQQIYLVAEVTTFGSFGGTVTISDEYYISLNIPKDSYLDLWVDKSDDLVTSVQYEYFDVEVQATSVPANAISVNLKTLQIGIESISPWTEDTLATARVKYTDWNDTNGVLDYFDQGTGEITARFSDTQFGMYLKEKTLLNNNTDINNEEITGLRLPDLELALSDYGYELSSVTVYEGGFYRKWKPFGTRYRRVHAVCTFSREEAFKVDDGQNPPGEGWTKTEFMSGENTLYVRKPYNGSITDWNLSAKDTTGGNIGYDYWKSKQSSSKSYPDGDTSRTFTTAIPFKDLVKSIYNGMSLTLNGKDIFSNFFWNDNEIDLPYFTVQKSGNNYVTGANPNVLNNIACLHTYNLKTTQETTSDADSAFEFSFTELIDDIRAKWPVYWYVGEDYTLYIEHVKHYDLKAKYLNLTLNPLLTETSKWKYDKTEMHEEFIFTMNNAGYLDFTNNNIKFNKIASNSRNNDNEIKIQSEILTTDVRYCLENPNDLENGIILICFDDDNNMRLADVPIANAIFENGDLALSNLLLKYWTYEGTYITGSINNKQSTFINTKRVREATPISLKGIESIDDFTQLITQLGFGMVKSRKINMAKQITTDIILLYRYDSVDIGQGMVLVVSEDVWFDFGNYEN